MTQLFAELQLMEPLLRAISAQGYETATPIQAQAIPHLLEGRDLLGIAQTGTGKTAAFALPILHRLGNSRRRRTPRRPRVVVMTPTRELATQIAQNFGAYGEHLDVRTTVVFGGVGQNPQVRALRGGVDVLVATPGRMIDLMEQGHIELQAVESFVLDEADRMLDMGFVHEVKKVLRKLPRERQSLLFSATMPKDIVSLARSILHDPVRVEVTPPATTVERIAQSVMFVHQGDKPALLVEVLRDPAIERVLVFTRTKHGANKVVKQLAAAGERAEAIHGNKSQTARERALDGFRSGRLRVLVATDIAARGIDVAGITHVVNFDLPNIPESYVHRIGRTARAGRDGTAISFCDAEERPFLRAIEKAIRVRVPVQDDHPFPAGHRGGREAARAGIRHRPAAKPKGRKPKVAAAGEGGSDSGQRRSGPGARPGSKPGSRSGSKPGGRPGSKPKPAATGGRRPPRGGKRKGKPGAGRPGRDGARPAQRGAKASAG